MATLRIEHIVSDPSKHGGKPRIAGKGILVQHIAALHNHGWTVEDLLTEYDLTPGEAYAALSYYFDHKEAIDQAIQDDETRVDRLTENGEIKPFDKLKRRIDARKTDRN